MPRIRKSQWEFGELFPPPPSHAAAEESPAPPNKSVPSTPDPSPVPERLGESPSQIEVTAVSRKIFSVSELTVGVRRALEDSFGSIFVSGEVSNYRMQTSGHAYFVLKDSRCQLGCVLFRGQGGRGRDGLQDGAHVTLGGELTVFEPRGQYQLRVLSVELEGVGALQAAFERLKARLAAEGLFESARKRAVPAFPRRVGLVTSSTGAAIRDVLHVVQRRYSGIEFILVPVRVQGAGAAGEIASAVDLLNQYDATGAALDVLLVTRGGGSLEDLWAFNEEIVARAIAASRVPVISAVGHEIDFTIADFVADLRAATPSAAAELLTRAYVDSRTVVAESARRLGWLTRRHLAEVADASAGLQKRLARWHPRRQLADRAQRLDEASAALVRNLRRELLERARRNQVLQQRLQAARPSAMLARRRREWAEWRRRLPAAALQQLRALRHEWMQRDSALRLLSPENVLDRGYSITFDATSGRVVRNAGEVTTGDRLRTRLKGGEVESEVTNSSRSSGGVP